LGVKGLAAIEAELRAGKGTLTSLGKKYGITTERVRQIATELGVTHYTLGALAARGRERRKSERRAHEKARAERKRAKAKQIAKLLQNGLTAADAARQLGKSVPRLDYTMSQLRRLFPDLLPRRRPGIKKGTRLAQRQPDPADIAMRTAKKAARAQRIAKLLSAGVSTAAIAERFGYSSADALRTEIGRLRRLLPGHLERRRPGRPKRAWHGG
jgi:DNA-binding CsgD family transcriptional regulator